MRSSLLSLACRKSLSNVGIFDSEFVCKTLLAECESLKAGNVTFPEISPKDCQQFEVWHVVVAAIKQFKT